MSDLNKLNRLLKVAGKTQLKVWKASKEALIDRIARLEAEGFEDPGEDADLNMPPPEKPVNDVSGLTQPVTTPARKPATEVDADKVVKHPAKLARGTDTESHCKKAVADARYNAKKEAKAKKDGDKPKKDKKDKKDKKNKKSKIKDNPDGTATKTTTAGNERRLGQDLAEKIKKQRENKGKQVDPDNFSVAELARELDIDPKVARAKLRRHEDKISKLHSKGQDRWTFPNAAKAELSKILNGK